MFKITVPWKTHFFYQKTLDTQEKKVYSAIISGLISWEEKIYLPERCDFDRTYEIFLMVLQDNPMLFHVSNHLSGTSGIHPYVKPQYVMDAKTYQEHYDKVKRFLDNCTRQLVNRSDFDKLRILHDAIRKHVIYHDTSTQNEHNILGTIVDRKAVCESIAKAYKLMCDITRVPCVVVFGRSIEFNQYVHSDNQSDPEEDNHAWNLVKLNGKWYWVDVTFDLTDPSENDSLPFFYDYFLCSDARFRRRHIPSKAVRIPECPEDFNFHRKLDKYAACEANIIEITKAAFHKKPYSLDFEVAPNFAVDKKQILAAVKKAARYIPYSVITYSYNEAMRIFHATFS